MSNEIRLIGLIGDKGLKAADFTAQLDKADPSQPLKLLIHSEGGSVMDGFHIYNALKDWPGRKEAAIQSAAMSIASYIAMACDEIEIADNGWLMIHNPYSVTEGDDALHETNAAFLKELKASMVSAYANRTKQPPESIQSMMKAETYISASEAVAMGMADRIRERPSKPMAMFKNANNLPLKVFASLFGSKSDGNTPGKTSGGKPMSDSNQPVAATLEEIQSAFPKAKAEFVVKCLSRKLPLASVAAVAAEELMTENEEMKTKCAAMEQEIVALKAQLAAKAEGEAPKEDEEEHAAKAKASAKPGVNPVANAGGKAKAQKTASEEIEELAQAHVSRGMPYAKAKQTVLSSNHALRERFVAEVNS